jgi:hypothetical protein
MLLAACSPKSAEADDPLAPARAGKLMCVFPVENLKQCSELTGLTFGTDGTANAHAQVQMAERPSIVISATFPVALKDGGFCGSIRPSDVDSVEVRIDGALPEPGRANEIRAAMKANIEARSIGEGCVKLLKRDAGFVVTSTFDGIVRPELDSPMIWVSPADGYTAR